MFEPDKSRFKDEKGRYIVQGLFLEDRYNTDLAVYTYDGEDKTYKGKVYPSLKRLFLEMQDPKEYLFANTYLYDWPHWKRLCKNKVVGRHIEEWREELELSLISEGVASLINLALNQDSYQASKYLADRGWDRSEKGRPSNAQVQEELKKRADKEEELDDDFKLLKLHKDAE
jgi:hypothetical protein